MASARDLMQPCAVTLDPRAHLETALDVLRQHDLAAVPVCCENGKLLGVVSRARLVDAVRRGADSIRGLIQRAATVPPETPPDELPPVMRQHGCAHLVVVDAGQPVGVIVSLLQSLFAPDPVAG